MSTPRISVVCDDSRLTQQITQQLHFLNVPIGEIIDKPREAYMQINLKEPRILLIAEPSEAVNIPQVIQSVRKVNETAPIIYLSKNAEFISLRELYRSGVMDVLQLPEEMEQLEKALERANVQYKKNIQRQELLQPKGPQGSSQVITVYSGKGGSGATFLASNLAQTLALNSGAKVLLVDLNMQFGGLHQLLDVPHDRNLGDLKSVLKELTFSQLNNVLYRREDSPLSVLLSPAHPQDAENFGSDDIELLLTACRQHFDLIVLDIPKELNEVSISAISQTDLLLYVLQLDRPSIVRMQQVYNILERYHLVKDESVALVVNRFSKKNDVTLDDLQKMTLFPVWGTIADGMNGLQQLVNLGQLLHTKANDKGPKGPARDMYQLTSVVLQKVGGEPSNGHIPKAQQQVG